MKEVWLNFENKIRCLSQTESITSFETVAKLADECGILEENELLEAVRFLNDLGSLQYFEKTGLKDRVVINPQV